MLQKRSRLSLTHLSRSRQHDLTRTQPRTTSLLNFLHLGTTFPDHFPHFGVGHDELDCDRFGARERGNVERFIVNPSYDEAECLGDSIKSTLDREDSLRVPRSALGNVYASTRFLSNLVDVSTSFTDDDARVLGHDQTSHVDRLGRRVRLGGGTGSSGLSRSDGGSSRQSRGFGRSDHRSGLGIVAAKIEEGIYKRTYVMVISSRVLRRCVRI